MNQYVTGAEIKRLRESKGMNQTELAEKLNVSNKTVSKWETGRGFPDIALIEPLAQMLGVSVAELFAGSSITNRNRSCNMLRGCFYVCPVCGNVIFAGGEAMISCCGITLPALEAEDADGSHLLTAEPVEDELYITVSHSMTKEHYISFIAVPSDNGMQLVKLYPEGNAEARFRRGRMRYVYFYCNRHGLFRADAGKILK